MENGTLLLSGINSFEEATFYDRASGEKRPLDITQAANPMIEEALDFAKIMNHPKDPALGLRYEEWVELSRNVNEVIYQLRKQAHVVFDADTTNEE